MDEITEFKKTRKEKNDWLIQGKFKNTLVSMLISLTDEFVENYPDIDEFCKEQLLDWCKENPVSDWLERNYERG